MSRAASESFSVSTGILADRREDMIVLELPGTDYRLHLQTDGSVGTDLNRRITGTLHARARRVDVVHTGGRYIEPVYGRPRRLQGTVIATDPSANTITIDCACRFVCQLTTGQKAAAFTEGMLVSFDIERGATFRAL